MTEPPPPPAYGTTRNRRASITYAEFERTASTLLAQGEKPGLDNIRHAIGGSPETIRTMLKRYWTELAAHVRAPAAALTRLPTDIADLAEDLWHRALALAAQTATHDDNAARERLEQIKRENELRAHALTVKERTLREREGTRDQTMIELRDQVATLLSIVNHNAETMAALQAAKIEAETRAQNDRQRLAQLLTRAVTRNQRISARPSRPLARPKAHPKPARRIKRPVLAKPGVLIRTPRQAKRPAHRRPSARR